MHKCEMADRESNSLTVAGEVDKFSEDASESAEPVPKRRRKSRNESEKRRREKLNVYIGELANMVPLCSAAQRKLDKTTILKLTVNYIKIYNDLTVSVLGGMSRSQSMLLSSDELGELMDQILNGVLIVLTTTGKLVYVSDSIESHLGYSKEDVVGKSIYDILHPDDRQHVMGELTRDDTILICPTSVQATGIASPDEKKSGKLPSRRAFEIRVKVSENENEKKEVYEELRCVGYLDDWPSQQAPFGAQDMVKGSQQLQLKQHADVGTVDKSKCFVGVALATRSNLKKPLSSETDNTPKEFLSKHTLDGKFLYVDTRSISITGYLPYEVLGTSIYRYVHHDDIKVVANYHQTLMDYGECTSGYYRLLTKGEQWIWTQSRIYISYNHWNSKPELYVSTSQVISEEEGLKTLDERDQQEKMLSLQLQQPLTAIDDGTADARESSTLTLAQWSSVENSHVSRPGAADTASLQLLPVRRDSAAVGTPADQLENAAPHPVRTDSDGDVAMTEDTKEEQSKNSGSIQTSAAELDSLSNLDLLSSKELESFMEAQRQLHEQLARKHSSLEDAIAKQKEQLKIIQQHMFLNIQAQLTVDQTKNQEVIAREFERTRILTEEHEKQEKRQQELSRKLQEQRKRANERYQTQLKQLLGNRPNALEELSQRQSCVSQPLQPWKSQSSSTKEDTISHQKSITQTQTSNQRQDLRCTEGRSRLMDVSGTTNTTLKSHPAQQLPQQFSGTLEADGQKDSGLMNIPTSCKQNNNSFGNRELHQPTRSLSLQQMQNQPAQSQPFPGSVQGQLQETSTVNLLPQQLGDWRLQKQQQQQIRGASSEMQQVSISDDRPSLPQNPVSSSRRLGSVAGIAPVDASAVSLQKQSTPYHLLQQAQSTSAATMQQKQQPETPALQNLQELLSSRDSVVQLVSSLSSRPDLTVALLSILQQVQSNSPPVSTTSSFSQSKAVAFQLQPQVGRNRVPLPVFQQQPLRQESFEQSRKHAATYQGSLQQQLLQLQEQQQVQLQQQRQRQQQQQQQVLSQLDNRQPREVHNRLGNAAGVIRCRPAATSNTSFVEAFQSRTPLTSAPTHTAANLLSEPQDYISTNSNQRKLKAKKDYFSSFTSSELQAMLLQPTARAQTCSEIAALSATPEQKKLKEDLLQYNPLLTEHQELLDMQQEQGKQLIINQQRQLLLQLQQNSAELEQEKADRQGSQMQQSQDEALQPTTLQASTSNSIQMLHNHDKRQEHHFNVVLEQNNKDESFKYAAPSGVSGSSPAWEQSLDPLSLEISQEDDQVLNLLLTEAALDPFFMDPVLWPEDGDYVANLNPD